MRPAVVAENLEKLKRPTVALQRALEARGDFLVGGRFTTVDLNVAAVLQWGMAIAPFVEFLKSDAPAVLAYIERACSRPTFQPVPPASFS